MSLFVAPAITATFAPTAAFVARQSAGVPQAEQRGERLALLQRLSCMVPALPVLEAHLQSPVISPYPLYLALCNLLGPMSLLRSGALPITPPAYDHAQPHLSFLPLLAADNLICSVVTAFGNHVRFKGVDEIERCVFVK